MQDRTINSALLALRKQVIRADADGLAHVEALLALRGVDMPTVRAAKLPDVAGKGLMARLVLGALCDGPHRMQAIVAHVHVARPEIDHRAAYTRTGQALAKLKRKGLVFRDGRLWST